MKIIGLMSGTSLDGLDIACCEINGYSTDIKVKLLAYDEVKMPEELKAKIQHACDIHGAGVDKICSLNYELGRWFGESTKDFMDRNHFSCDEIAAVCSHGQTIYHIPHDRDGLVKSTLQIGEPAVIAWLTGCQVISDFRAMDMAAGGEGAPLVPYVDYLLYRSAEKKRILLNIGGVSNVTVLEPNCQEEDIAAFDTGPGNMMIDEAMRHFYHKEYDENGFIARHGHVIDDLFEELKHDPYVDAKPPKSTGREVFGRQCVEKILQQRPQAKGEDIVCTFTHFTSYCTARNIHLFLENDRKTDELIVSGGGSHNGFLLELLQKDLGHGKVLTQEDIGFSSDAKEAIAFAVLGNETLHGHYANMKSATGASQNVVLGCITPKIKRNI
ncbi:MAG: anhydro-N-acetylmuramic acid kinase [Erysipelotrichaceae bacterium]|nr:anhydro-N-acetylmuramic acid kinase [Erysipelotrichaceae bacterium]